MPTSGIGGDNDYPYGQAQRDFLTYREAAASFATKEQVVAVRESLQELKAVVTNLTPRTELQVHWQLEDARYNDIKTSLSSIQSDVEATKKNRLPGYVLNAIGWVIAIAAILVKVHS